MALPFYDCNCMIGTRQWRHFVQPQTLGDFQRDFDYYDIMGALVYHAAAVEYSQDYGNRKLLREIGDDPRLMPQWVVLPHQAGEMAPGNELVEEMMALGVRAARMYPKSHGFGVSEEVCGELLGALETRRVPLFIDHAELDLPAAGELARRYPELPIVLCGVYWHYDRVIFGMLAGAVGASGPSHHGQPKAITNLYFDTWAYQNHRGYEAFVERLGSERLLFCTNLPHRSPGAARMMTCYENLTEKDRENIAGRNLLRLLGGVRGAQGREVPEWREPPAHPEDDPIVAAVRAGQPLRKEFVLDSHNHLGHPGCKGIDLCAIPANDGDGLVGTMDRLGVDIACPSSWAGITYAGPDANDHTLGAAAKHPGRILPWGCLNPSYPQVFEAEFERLFVGGKVIGYKPAPFRQVVPLTDPVHFPVYEWCSKRRAPVLCGDGPMRLAEVTELAPKYPEVPFLNAHTGSNYEFAENTIETARKYSNVFAEITYTLIWYGMIEYLVEELGPERVLYGSDCVMRDLAPQVGWVAWARIPVEAKRRVLGLNMADILGLPEARRRSLSG